MNAEVWLSPLSLRLAMSLFHFLWQGLVIALLAVVGGWLLQRSAARVRYTFHVGAMFLMVSCLPVTFAFVQASHVDDAAVAKNAASAARGERQLGSTTTDSPIGGPVSHASDTRRTDRRRTTGVTARTGELLARGRGLQNVAPYVAAIYIAGVVVMMFRLAVGLRGGQVLRRACTRVDDEGFCAEVRCRAEAMGLKAIPIVAQCRQISVPVVVGVVRPMIVLPSLLLGGLSTDQVQSLVAHELAHIRRFDPLLNLMQRLIESVLFFHPAVWWVSRRVGIERENACDDLVLASGCRRASYADALVRAAEFSSELRTAQRVHNGAALAASGTRGSDFKRRILRLLETTDTPQLGHSRMAILGIFAVTVLVLSNALILQTWDDKNVAFGSEPDAVSRPVEEVKPVAVSADLPKSRAEATHATFYGINVTGDRVIYLVDRSQSLSGSTDWRETQRRLIASIAGLHAEQEFQVLFYNERVTEVRPIADGGDSSRYLSTVDDDVRVRVKTLIRATVPTGASNHFAALRAALRNRPDELFFVTDAGDPELTQQELQAVKRQNGPNARVHAIELSGTPDGSRWLKELARQNGGSYRRVASSKEAAAAVAADELADVRAAFDELVAAKHWREQSRASKKLAAFGRRALRTVIKGTKHEKGEVRENCYTLICRHFATEPTGIDALIRGTQEKGDSRESKRIRYSCTFCLGTHKVARAAKALREVYDSNRDLRLTAAKSLAEIGHKDVLVTLYDHLGSDHYMSRYQANLGIKALTGRDLNAFAEYDWSEGAFVSGGVEAKRVGRSAEDAEIKSKRFRAIADFHHWLDKEKPELAKFLNPHGR